MSLSPTASTEAKAGALALLVHGAFLLLLIFGVSWQTEHPTPVSADIWEALPEPVPEPRPEPREAPRPTPEPKPVIKEDPPEPKPDIAL